MERKFSKMGKDDLIKAFAELAPKLHPEGPLVNIVARVGAGTNEIENGNITDAQARELGAALDDLYEHVISFT